MQNDYGSASPSASQSDTESVSRISRQAYENDDFPDAFVEYEDIQNEVDGVPISRERREKRTEHLNAHMLSTVTKNVAEFIRKGMGRFKQDDSLRYLHDHYMDTYREKRFRHIGASMNILVQKRKMNTEEAGWIMHAAGRSVKKGDDTLMWTLIRGTEPVRVVDYTLTYGSITSWIDPRTFFDLQMPPDVMRVLEYRIGMMVLISKSYRVLSTPLVPKPVESDKPVFPELRWPKYGPPATGADHKVAGADHKGPGAAIDPKYPEKVKAAEAALEALQKSAETAAAAPPVPKHKVAADAPAVHYDFVTLACDVFECIRYKQRLLRDCPVRPVRYSGMPEDAVRLERFLLNKLKSNPDKYFESDGRKRILQSTLPIGAEDRYKRQTPRAMGFFTDEEVFRSAFVEERLVERFDSLGDGTITYERVHVADEAAIEKINAQREYPIYTSKADADGKIETRNNYLKERDEIWKKNLQRGIVEKPDCFIASDGQTVSQRMLDGFVLEMAPETRDMWLLAAFTSWWKSAMSSTDFRDEHCVMWSDWWSDVAADGRIKDPFRRFFGQSEGMRPMLVCFGYNRWFVYYKYAFETPYLPSASDPKGIPVHDRSMLAALVHYIRIIKNNYEGRVGPGQVFAEHPEFWALSEEELLAQQKDKAAKYTYKSAKQVIAEARQNVTVVDVKTR